MQGEGTVDDRKIGSSGFLPDTALERLDQDRLTHRVYVDALKDIVQTCHTPFTIGVMGRWGTGKTSIGNMLLGEIRADASLRQRFKTMLFDVWKYPGDSLRRKFLMEVADCLASGEALTSREELWEELYSSRSQESERTWRFDPQAARHWWLSVILYAVVAAAIVVWAWLSFPASQAGQATAASFLVGVVWVCVAVVRSSFGETHYVSSSRVSAPPLHSPEQFEERFEALLKAGGVSSEPGARRLVVVVDNLDRCSSEGAVEALRTIKTFLEKDGCVFIITCDDQALKEHLVEVYKWHDEQSEAEEYLMKFFNTAIRIKVARQDRIQLAEKLASEMGFPSGVAEVLWAAAPDSPRRVKQFLNRLRALEVVFEHEEQSGRLTPIVRQELPFVAKMLVIEEKWPAFVEHLRRDDELLERIGQALQDPSRLKDDANSDLRQFIGDHPPDGYSDLKEFLIATSSVRVEDVRPFLALRQDSHELMVGEPGQLRRAVRMGSVDRVLDLLAGAEGDELLASWQVIHEVINEERVAGRVHFARSALKVGVEIFSGCPNGLRTLLADGMALTACSYEDAIAEILPSKVLVVLQHARLAWARQGATDRLVHTFAAVSHSRRDLVRGLRDHHALFTDDQLQRVGGSLADQLEEDWDKAVGLVEEIGWDHDGVRRLVRSEPRLLSVIVGQIDPSDLDKARSAGSLFVRFTDAAEQPVRAELCDRIGKLLVHPSSPPMGPQKELALSMLDRLDASDIPQANIDPLVANLRQAFDEVGSTEGKRRLLWHALRIRDRASEGERRSVDSKLKAAVGEWPPDHVRDLVQPEVVGTSADLAAICREALRSRIAKMAAPREYIVWLLNLYVGILPAEDGSADLGELLGSLLVSGGSDVVEVAAEAVQQHFSEFDRKQQVSLLGELRKRANSLEVADKHIALYPLVALVTKTDSAALRNGIGNDLLELMKSADFRGVKLGVRQYRAYASRLSLAHRSSVARELIRHLESSLHRIDHNFAPLIQVAIHEAQAKKARQNTRTQLVDLLIDLCQPNRTEEQRLLGLRGMAEWAALPRGTLPEIRELVEDTLSADAGSSEALAQAAIEAREHIRAVTAPTRRLHKPSGIGVWTTLESGDVGEFSDTRKGPRKPPVLCNPLYPGWPGLGSARWVWIKERPSDPEAKEEQVVWHRLNVDVHRPTVGLFNAALSLRVDDAVNVTVNRQSAGSARGSSDITELDLTLFLTQGPNLIEMEIQNDFVSLDSTGLTNPSGIIYRLEIA